MTVVGARDDMGVLDMTVWALGMAIGFRHGKGRAGITVCKEGETGWRD